MVKADCQNELRQSVPKNAINLHLGSMENLVYRIFKLLHYLGTRLVKTVVILARYSVYTNQYDFIEKIVTIENFIFLRLKSHFCDENHFRRKSHFCDESHFRPFYPFLRRKSQTVSTKVFATKVISPVLKGRTHDWTALFLGSNLT